MDSQALVSVGTSELGALLRAHRERCDMTVEEVARRARHPAPILEALETGIHEMSVEELADLSDHYDFTTTASELALTTIVLNIEQAWVSLSWAKRPSSDSARPADRVLARYLHLLYADRDEPMGTRLSMRDVDLTVLRASLALRSDDVIEQIGRMDVAEKEEGKSKGFLLLSAAVCLAGSMLISDPSPEPASTIPVSPAATAASEATDTGATGVAGVVSVEIGSAVSITRSPASSGETIAGAVVTEIGTAMVVER